MSKRYGRNRRRRAREELAKITAERDRLTEQTRGYVQTCLAFASEIEKLKHDLAIWKPRIRLKPDEHFRGGDVAYEMRVHRDVLRFAQDAEAVIDLMCRDAKAAILRDLRPVF